MPSFRHQRDGKEMTIDHRPIPFSSFAGIDKPRQRRMLAANPWRCMELTLRSKKTTTEECLAYLRQAHDFLIAAEAAKATARPLLLYYSFLNLAKALAKHLCPAKDLVHANLGISEAQTNTKCKKFTLTAQKVKVKRSYGKYASILREFSRALGWNPPPTVDASYRVCDLLSQIPAIHRSYSHTCGRVERMFTIEGAQFRYDHLTREAWVIMWVHKSEFGKTRPLRELVSRSYIKKWWEVVESDDSHRDSYAFETESCSYGKSPVEASAEIGSRSVKAGIMAILTSNGYRYYLGNFEPKIRLHQLLATYMTTFYFGSVARYNPVFYEKALRSEYGWVIEEFLATQAHQFVYLIASALLEREVVCPWALRTSEPPI